MDVLAPPMKLEDILLAYVTRDQKAVAYETLAERGERLNTWQRMLYHFILQTEESTAEKRTPPRMIFTTIPQLRQWLSKDELPKDTLAQVVYYMYANGFISAPTEEAMRAWHPDEG
jgi:hypothetical protein